MVKQGEKTVEELMKSQETEEASSEEQETAQHWKIPPTRVASDDCAIYVGRVIEDKEITNEGTAHYVHTGEWVELFPTQNLKELISLAKVVGSSEMSDSKDMIVGQAEALHELCLALSKRVVAWSWTDNGGEPLPQPYKAPDVLEELDNDELMWLLGAAQGNETKVDRKNG